MNNKLLALLEKQKRENLVERDVEDLYNMVSQRSAIPVEDIAKIGGVESHHGKYEDNFAGSKAKGVFQLMPSLIKSLNPKGLSSPKSYSTQEDTMVEYLDEIKRKLGDSPSAEDLYMHHNLGAGKSKKLRRASSNTPIENLLPEKVIDQNAKFYKNKTVKQAKNEIKKMLDNRGSEFNFTPKFEDLLSEDEEYVTKKRK